MEITKRLKNEKDLDIILKEISESDNILSYSKKEWLALDNNVFYGYLDNKIVGVAVIKEMRNNWVEISPLLVLKEFRNEGYGKELAQYLLPYLKDKKLFASSRNPITQKWLIEKGFKEVNPFFLPLSPPFIPLDIVLHVIKNGLKIHKIKDLATKGLKGNWKYYIKK